jgi:Flp pilus assembly protein TadD
MKSLAGQNQRQLDGACISLARAVELEPSNPQRHVSLALTLLSLGRLDGAAPLHREAVEKYRHAMQLRPDYAAAYHGLGQSLIALGQAAAAEVFLRQAARCERDSPTILNNP